MGLSFIGTAHAATEHADKHGSAFPPFDSTYFASQLFWLAVTFGLTYWFLKTIALPRIAGILGDRQGRIAADLKQAEDAQRAAEDAAKQFEANILQAKTNAQSIGRSARDTAAKEADARRQSVESDIAAKMVAAEKAIADTKARAMGNVEGIARDAAHAIIERLTGKAPAGNAVDAALSALGRKGA